MAEEDVARLHKHLQKQFHDKEPRGFQVELVKCQQERRDALCQAATGLGKTAVAAGPYALPENKGKVTLMVSPLIGLQNEMVSKLSMCSLRSW
jgi:superfamily II DNA helicase RecQ